jgi:hypothetical protein
MSHQALEPVLIAVELGAEWPRWMSELVRKSPRRVVTQDEGEAAASFSLRVAEVAHALAGSGARLGSAVVLCNERADPSQDAARRELARQVLPELGGRGRLVLTAPERAGARLQEALKALARDVESHAKAPVVRFGERTVSGRGRPRRLAKVA